MQNVIVILIGIFVFGTVGWKVYKLLTRKPQPNDRCGGCSGCDLKEKTKCNL